MKVVVQRVSQASVDVVNELGTIDPTFEPQQIGSGFMLLVGVTDEDGEEQLSWLAHKILNLRVFEDEQGKMTVPSKTSAAKSSPFRSLRCLPT